MEILIDLIKGLYILFISQLLPILFILVPIFLVLLTNKLAKNIKTEEKARKRRNIYRACFLVVLILIIIVIIRFIIAFNTPVTPASTLITYTNQEIEAYNNMFESYKGLQPGAQVKSLITRVIANSKTYKDEPNKVPGIVFFKESEESGEEIVFDSKVSYKNSELIDEYIKEVVNIRNSIYPKKEYYVKCEKRSEDGLIDTIIIVQIPTQSEYNSKNRKEKMEQFIENNRNYIKGE